MRAFRALLWNVDGTVAETERDGHRVAFNHAFAACGLPWHWSDEHYGELMGLSHGRERLLRHMNGRADVPARAGARYELAQRLQAMQRECYADLLRSRPLALRGGVAAMIEECLRRGVRLGLATAATRLNLHALLAGHWGPGWQRWFDAVVCREDVVRRPPHPEAYARALLAMRLAPSDVVAMEDSPAGAAAARAIDAPVVVARGVYFEHARFHGAIAVGPGLDRRGGWEPSLDAGSGSVGRIELADIEAWRARAATVGR